MKYLYVIFSTVFLVFNTAVVAEESTTDFGLTNPTEDQFIKALVPRPASRSIRPLSNKDLKQKPVAINLTLKFEFDSARLSKTTKSTLDSLGPALQDAKLAAYSFKIEGHTDAVGGGVYNQHLSQRRANSVKKYLAEKFDISLARLTTLGKGETELIDPKNPASPKNRRVKIVNIGATN